MGGELIATLRRAEGLGSRTQGVVTATALISGSLLLSRLLGLVRVAVFAGVYGTGRAFKDYNAAFRIPDILFTVVAGGALASAFIPVFAGLLEHRKDDEAWEVANTVLNTVLVVMVAVAAIFFIFAPQITHVLNPGKLFTPADVAETANLSRIMLVQPILLGLGGIFVAMQNSYRRFILPAGAPLIYNVSIIVGAAIFSGWFNFSVYAAAWAVSIGALLMFEIQIWGVATDAWRYRFQFNWRLPSTRTVMRLMFPRMIGLSAYQVMLIVTFVLASQLSNATLNTSIYYAWTLIMFPVGAVGTAFGVAVFPTISRHAATSQMKEVERIVRNGLRGILFLALPAMAGLIVLRTPIIQLIFAHGSWTPHSTTATAYALLFYAFCVPPLAAMEICTRAFYAVQNTMTPVIIAVVASAADALFCIILFNAFGPTHAQGGLGLGTALAVWLQVGMLVIALDRKMPGIVDRELRRGISAMVVATFLMSLGTYVIVAVTGTIVPSGSFIRALLQTAIGVTVGTIVYLGSAHILRIPELSRAVTIVARLTPRPKRERS